MPDQITVGDRRHRNHVVANDAQGRLVRRGEEEDVMSIRVTVCPARCHRTRRGPRALHIEVGRDYMWHLSEEEARDLEADLRLALDKLARIEARSIRRSGKSR